MSESLAVPSLDVLVINALRPQGAGLHFNRGSLFFSGAILHAAHIAHPYRPLNRRASHQVLSVMLAPADQFAKTPYFVICVSR